MVANVVSHLWEWKPVLKKHMVFLEMDFNLYTQPVLLRHYLYIDVKDWLVNSA